ncbi:hypothetical protein SAMN06298226_1680 [Nitrosovibrio sp. Nv4]|nr:hypothetical protein SAMN06298226_1680 [Nitrosovibrio sp. Nv4]
MGGNEHNLQGFPGHKHPAHSACATVAEAPSMVARTIGVINRKIAAVIVFTVIPSYLIFISLRLADARCLQPVQPCKSLMLAGNCFKYLR